MLAKRDQGGYCEFLLYNSLAELYRRGDAARAQFLHHPGLRTDPAGIELGVRVAVAAIGSMIDQLYDE